MLNPAVAERGKWELSEGDEIAPGRSVLKLLGGGNRYEVYLVWDDRLFAMMVAKVLRPEFAGSESSLRSLRREALALEALSHPVLLRGFGAALEGDHPHLLVEHLEGPTLRRLIKRGGRVSVEQALPLALNLASVAHYLAGEEWVHLDIKPDNIVMGIPPRLIDLSLAHTFERARRIDDYIGTNAYMPPEQCAPGQAGQIGPASDVWGIGASLYHAISGTLPFSKPASRDDSAPLEERFPQLVEEPRPWPARVPEPLGDAVLACLRKDPAERPAAAELAASLEPSVARLPKKLLLGRRGAR
jgi:eukaryotic-like serine/threonine-protein kinase